MRLTQVRVVHAETISPQQYESRKHEVELTLVAGEDESFEDSHIQALSQKAVDAVRDYLGVKPRKILTPETVLAPKEAEKLGSEKSEVVKTLEATDAATKERKAPAKRPKDAPPPKDGPEPFNDKLPPALNPEDKEPEDHEIFKGFAGARLPPKMMTDDQLQIESDYILEEFEKATSLTAMKIILERNMEFLGELRERLPNQNDIVTRAYRDRRKQLREEEDE